LTTLSADRDGIEALLLYGYDREKLRTSPEDLFHCEIRTTLKLQQSSVGSEGATQKLRFELELLESAFALALNLFEPFAICCAVLSTAVIIGKQLADLRVCPSSIQANGIGHLRGRAARFGNR